MPTAQTSLADTAATELSHPGAEVKPAGTAGLTAATVLAVAAFSGTVVVAGAAPDSARHATTAHPASARAGTQSAIVRIADSYPLRPACTGRSNSRPCRSSESTGMGCREPGLIMHQPRT